jgi:hypothetical protein
MGNTKKYLILGALLLVTVSIGCTGGSSQNYVRPNGSVVKNPESCVEVAQITTIPPETQIISNIIEITPDMTSAQIENAEKNNQEIMDTIERNKIRTGIIEDIVLPQKSLDYSLCIDIEQNIYIWRHIRESEKREKCGILFILIDEEMKESNGHGRVKLYFIEQAKVKKLMEQSSAWNKGIEMEYQGEGFELITTSVWTIYYPNGVSDYLSNISEFNRTLINMNSEFITLHPYVGMDLYNVPLYVEGNGITIAPR